MQQVPQRHGRRNRTDEDNIMQTPLKTHRELYPQQYSHPLVGKRVKVSSAADPIEGRVERVVSSRFGQLAILEGYGAEQAWQVSHCRVIA